MIFVCTGNICRSPIAEYMLREQLGPDSDWVVSSAGVMAGRGASASSLGVHVMQEVGVDMKDHVSSPMSQELVDAASVIVVMAGAHAEQLEYLFPNSRDKIFLLKSFDSDAIESDLEDPIGATVDVYRSVREQIKRAMPGLIGFLNEQG